MSQNALVRTIWSSSYSSYANCSDLLYNFFQKNLRKKVYILITIQSKRTFKLKNKTDYFEKLINFQLKLRKYSITQALNGKTILKSDHLFRGQGALDRHSNKYVKIIATTALVLYIIIVSLNQRTFKRFTFCFLLLNQYVTNKTNCKSI